VGEELTAVIAIDKERERISLGFKHTTPNPWDDVERRDPVRALCGMDLVRCGAFVKLEDGLEALIHITEFSWWKKSSQPADLLKIGQEVEAAVNTVSPKDRKIPLGIHPPLSDRLYRQRNCPKHDQRRRFRRVGAGRPGHDARF
jgi:small subunit ribosomal protein S1